MSELSLVYYPSLREANLARQAEWDNRSVSVSEALLHLG